MARTTFRSSNEARARRWWSFQASRGVGGTRARSWTRWRRWHRVITFSLGDERDGQDAGPRIDASQSRWQAALDRLRNPGSGDRWRLVWRVGSAAFRGPRASRTAGTGDDVGARTALASAAQARCLCSLPLAVRPRVSRGSAVQAAPGSEGGVARVARPSQVPSRAGAHDRRLRPFRLLGWPPAPVSSRRTTGWPTAA